MYKVRPEIRYLLTGVGIGLLITILAAPAILLLLDSTSAPLQFAPSTPFAALNARTPTPVLAGGILLELTAPARVRNEPPPSFPTPAQDVVATWVTEGRLDFRGPLDEERQILLYQASLRYIAPTPAESRRVGERINGSGYGSPDLICGPLALAILQDIGLVTYELIPHDFWLLNPFDATGAELLRRAFPPTFFEQVIVPTRIDQVNWQETPLLPGDFVYLRAGIGGNFDHMLTVNRVDSNGRAYAVTNYGTPEGFVIDEVLLYDPFNPGQGMFYVWTERPNALLGSTGFDGLVLWRTKERR
jgi:hypothetical protein